MPAASTWTAAKPAMLAASMKLRRIYYFSFIASLPRGKFLVVRETALVKGLDIVSWWSQRLRSANALGRAAWCWAWPRRCCVAASLRWLFSDPRSVRGLPSAAPASRAARVQPAPSPTGISRSDTPRLGGARAGRMPRATAAGRALAGLVPGLADSKGMEWPGRLTARVLRLVLRGLRRRTTAAPGGVDAHGMAHGLGHPRVRILVQTVPRPRRKRVLSESAGKMSSR